jgi:hypothetical protein
MALVKTLNYKGVDCNYWKIIGMTGDSKNTVTYVELNLYYTKAARIAGISNELQRRVFVFNQLDLTREDAYLLIKDAQTDELGNQNNIPTSPVIKFFSDATDDL